MTAREWTFLLDETTVPDRALIGGKAWSVGRMNVLGLPVPPAFVITTKACLAYLENGDLPTGLAGEIATGLAWLEQQTGRTFGGGEKPLLLSVRSGAAVSMPGMMDTILNLGIDNTTESALAAETGLPRFAQDTHCRFLELFASIVLKTSTDLDRDSSPQDWRTHVISRGQEIPARADACLMAAIRAVFDSWNTRRARKYREHNKISHELGTAVTIQAMVFGNLDEKSGTGVVFSRNPLTGEAIAYGEYLPRAQGEDVVSGKFTPLPLSAMLDVNPNAHAALLDACGLLEREHQDMQDIEFTVQSGKLYLLQARSAKRAPDAAVRAAIDMVEEGLIDVDRALSRVSPDQIKTLLLPRLAGGAASTAHVLARGEGACPGVASGVFVTDADEAERRAANGEDIILLRATTSPDDVHGMIAARAIVTEQGGSTSHAAVVSRALGRPCVVGVGSDALLQAGNTATVDGATGTVYAGRLAVEMPDEDCDPRLVTLIKWAKGRAQTLGISPIVTKPVLPALLSSIEVTA
jgi:pyruvate, orthophosphate dikinase